jgi:hypothetical protein
VSSSIFKEINELCKKHDKYLINILAFGKDFNCVDTIFPIYENLNEVSWQEKIIQNNVVKTMKEVIINDQTFDHRICHLGNENNLRVAKIFKNAIENKLTNLHHKFIKNYKWAEFDDSLQKMFENKGKIV